MTTRRTERASQAGNSYTAYPRWKRLLCLFGIHWHRERKTYSHAVGLSDCRCLICGKEWVESFW